MSLHSNVPSLDDFQFTFEAYLDDSVRIEPDVSAMLFAVHAAPRYPVCR